MKNIVNYLILARMSALFCPLLITSLMASAIANASGEATRLTNPNAVSIEILGRGLRYGLGYDRVLNDDFVAGFSFGTATMNNADGTDAGISATMIPMYMNFYFLREGGSLFATGGATFVTNPRDVDHKTAQLSGLTMSSSGIFPSFGLGYENRGETGFLFRMTAYVNIDRNVKPWLGFTFGYAF